MVLLIVPETVIVQNGLLMNELIVLVHLYKTKHPLGSNKNGLFNCTWVNFYLVQNKNTVPGLTKSDFLIVPGTVNFYLVQNKNTVPGLIKSYFLIVPGTVFLLLNCCCFAVN
jgi:hypothetical protein